jgi:hypothetical protein
MNRKNTKLEAAVNKLFAAVFGSAAESNLPGGWYDYAPGQELTLQLPGNNLLIIDLAKQEISYFSEVDDVWRDIPAKGQWSRTSAIIELLEDDPDENKNHILSIADSIVRWETSEVRVDVWGLTEEDVPYFARQAGLAGCVLKLKGSVSGVRRSMPLSSFDYQLVKIVKDETDLNETSITKDLDAEFTLGYEEVFSDGWNGQGKGVSLKDDAITRDQIKEVIVHYANSGYDFIGGNPKSGLLVFIRDAKKSLGKLKPVSDDASQKLAKLLLRGGMQLKLGESFTAELKKFPKSGNNARDGLFMIVRRGIQVALAKANGLPSGIVWQSTFVNNESAMKGTIVGATKDLPETVRLLGGAEAVIDVDEYNKLTGAGKKPGDLVVVNPEDIWVMRTSGEKGKRPVHISAQVIRRAPEIISNHLQRLNTAMMRGFVQACASDADKRSLYDYLPGFGSLGRIKTAGIKLMLKPVYDAEKRRYTGEYVVDENLKRVLSQLLLKAVRKGWTVPGWSEYILLDGTLSVDTGDQVPGISVPKSWGKKVGDTVVMVAYPVLPALDKKGRSTGVFTCRVERLNTGDFVGIHPMVAKFALRDEDGDQPIFLDVNCPEVGIARINLTTKAADGGKVKVNKLHKEGSIANAMMVLDVYLRQCSAEIGIVDNKVTSAMLYLGNKEPQTPTGEPVRTYMSKVIQSVIESLKHITEDVYSVDVFNGWLKQAIPSSFDPETGAFMKHPELDAQKVRDSEGTFSSVSLEDLRKAVQKTKESGVATSGWMELIEAALGFGLNTNGFVRPDYYMVPGKELYKALSELVENGDTRNKLLWKAKELRDEAFKLAKYEGWDVAKKFLRLKSRELAAELPVAEFLLLNAASIFVSSKSAFFFVEFCSTEFLKVLAYLADNPDTDPRKALGLTRRNATKADRVIKTEVSSGYVTTRLWVSGRELGENEIAVGDLVAGMGTTAVVNNTIYNVKGTLIGAFTVVSVDRRTAKGVDLTIKAAQ